MSHPATDQIMDRAESDAIEFVLDLGIDTTNPAFDKMVDIKMEEFYKEAMEQPGPHG